MKVRLLSRKGENKAGAIVDYDEPTAEWLVSHNYALAMPAPGKPESNDNDDDAKSDAKAETPAPPRRGRPPRKAE